jgi:hypothetical protein
MPDRNYGLTVQIGHSYDGVNETVDDSRTFTVTKVAGAKAVFSRLYVRCKQPDGTMAVFNILAGEAPKAVSGAGNWGFEYDDIEANSAVSGKLFIAVIDDTGVTKVYWSVTGTVLRTQKIYFDMPDRDYGITVRIGHDGTVDDYKTFTVTKAAAPATLTFTVAPSLPWKAGQTVTFQATLTAGGVPVSGETINFFYRPPGTTPVYVVQVATTGTDGVARASWSVPIATDWHTLACAAWEWGALSGGPAYSGVISNIITGKVAYNTRISISAPATVAPGQSFTITGKLEYESSSGVWSPLAGKTVSLYYNGTLIGNVTTGSDGSYSATASIPTAGSYTLRADYAGEGF